MTSGVRWPGSDSSYCGIGRGGADFGEAMLSRASLFSLAIFATQPVIGAEGARARIISVVREFELSDERAPAQLRPDATLEMLDLDRSDRERKRLWRDVPGSGVIYERRVLRIVIVRLSADRATVDARASGFVVDYTPDGSTERSDPHAVLDRIELWRTGGGWRIKSVARLVRR
jgi:hypothetical protein